MIDAHLRSCPRQIGPADRVPLPFQFNPCVCVSFLFLVLRIWLRGPQVPAAWRAELDSDALRARAQAFKDEAGQEARHSYPGGATGKAWRTDFTDATSPTACRAHGPVALWRVGAVESFRATFEHCPFFEGAGLERWRVGRGKDFGCMFWGCVSLQPRLGAGRG